MEAPSIFRRSEDERAPEVEVQGEDIVIRPQSGNGESLPETRRVKLPPTKWQ